MQITLGVLPLNIIHNPLYRVVFLFLACGLSRSFFCRFFSFFSYLRSQGLTLTLTLVGGVSVIFSCPADHVVYYILLGIGMVGSVEAHPIG